MAASIKSIKQKSLVTCFATMNSSICLHVRRVYHEYTCAYTFVAILLLSLFTGSGDVTACIFFGVILNETSKCTITLGDLLQNAQSVTAMK